MALVLLLVLFVEIHNTFVEVIRQGIESLGGKGNVRNNEAMEYFIGGVKLVPAHGSERFFIAPPIFVVTGDHQLRSPWQMLTVNGDKIYREPMKDTRGSHHSKKACRVVKEEMPMEREHISRGGVQGAIKPSEGIFTSSIIEPQVGAVVF